MASQQSIPSPKILLFNGANGQWEKHIDGTYYLHEADVTPQDQISVRQKGGPDPPPVVPHPESLSAQAVYTIARVSKLAVTLIQVLFNGADNNILRLQLESWWWSSWLSYGTVWS